MAKQGAAQLVGHVGHERAGADEREAGAFGDHLDDRSDGQAEIVRDLRGDLDRGRTRIGGAAQDHEETSPVVLMPATTISPDAAAASSEPLTTTAGSVDKPTEKSVEGLGAAAAALWQATARLMAKSDRTRLGFMRILRFAPKFGGWAKGNLSRAGKAMVL